MIGYNFYWPLMATGHLSIILYIHFLIVSYIEQKFESSFSCPYSIVYLILLSTSPQSLIVYNNIIITILEQLPDYSN